MTIDYPTIWEITTQSEAQTRALGRGLGQAVEGGEIILLDGPLGAGKTCLANGIARGLAIEQPLISPTYVILRSYRSPRELTLHHLDFYRLGGDEDLETVGLDDLLAEDAVILAEWPGVCPSAFEAFTLWLRIEILGDDTRRIVAHGGELPIPEALARPEAIEQAIAQSQSQ